MVDELTAEVSGPEDKFKLVYIIFYWLGIGTLLPWNMFITMVAYWNYKLRTCDGCETTHILTDTPEVVVPGNSTYSHPGGLGTWDCPNNLQKTWAGYLAVASIIPNMTFLILNGVVGHHFKTLPRMVISLIFVILSFIFTSIMVQVDTDSWQSTFMYVTLASVVFININAAIFEGGILRVAGRFPPAYICAVFSGEAVGGIFASGTNVVVLALGATAIQLAFFCFILSVVFMFTALIAFAVATMSKFYQHYLGEKPGRDLETKPKDSNRLQEKDLIKVNPGQLLLQILPHAISVHLNFLVTLGMCTSVLMYLCISEIVNMCTCALVY